MEVITPLVIVDNILLQRQKSWFCYPNSKGGKLLQYKHDFGKLKFVRISANFPLIWVHLCFCYSSGLLSDVSLWTRTLKLFHELEMLDCPHSLKSKQDISFYGRLLPPPPASFSTQHLAKMDKLWDVKIPLTVSKPSLLCLS